jgi:hypothetical protein
VPDFNHWEHCNLYITDKSSRFSGRLRSRGLEVELRDGAVIAYSGVSQEVHRQFMNAPSPTSYYEDKIADEFSARRL